VVSGTRSAPARALRMAGTAVAVALAIGLTPTVATAAPSNSQIAAAKAAADALTNQIGDLTARLAGAQDAVDAAHAKSALALDDFQAKQAAYEAAQQQADAAAVASAHAAAALGVAHDELVAFARRSYMQGSTYPGAQALLTSATPGQMIERAALLEAAGGHRSDVVDRVTVLQQQATATEAVARTTLTDAGTLKEKADAALAVATQDEVSARAQAAQIGTQQAQLQTELAAAQQQLTVMVGEKAAADRTAALLAAAPKPAPPAAAPAPSAPSKQPAPAPSGNPIPAGSGSASAARTAIDAAMEYLGTPYAWGGGGTRGPGPGMDPDEGVIGFDCSGLTQYAYAQAHISIPRNSRAQYASLPKVSSDDLQAGDLVFWGSGGSDPGSIIHVAIYLGGGKVVQAPQSGDVVKVSNMWWRNYVGAVRPSAA
jgi:cell wall-associated NlpC family hydrolase